MYPQGLFTNKILLMQRYNFCMYHPQYHTFHQFNMHFIISSFSSQHQLNISFHQLNIFNNSDIQLLKWQLEFDIVKENIQFFVYIAYSIIQIIIFHSLCLLGLPCENLWSRFRKWCGLGNIVSLQYPWTLESSMQISFSITMYLSFLMHHFTATCFVCYYFKKLVSIITLRKGMGEPAIIF